MIAYIKGTYAGRFDGGVIIENNNIGYEVMTPDNSRVYLLSEGDETIMYTSMIVKEDSLSICGFSDRETLELFKKLISVSGVGAKGAMAILSSMPTAELKRAIVFEDADSLKRAQGVGKKTAERIVLELKDKIGDVAGFGSTPEVSMADIPGVPASNGPRDEAIAALVSLGYSKAEASLALSKVSAETVEDYIKLALKNL